MPIAMKINLHSLQSNLFGGLTAAVVALPLSLAFGVASGLGAEAGIYTAVAMGFFASVFGGTKTQISAPTAPMTVAMAVIVTSHASTLAEALTVVVMAGMLQVLLGVSRIGRFVAYTPHVVVSGFMSGIGVIIILMQLLPAIGMSVEPGGAVDAVRGFFTNIGAANLDAVAIAVGTFAVMVLWPVPWRKFLPAPLVALAAGTALGVFWFAEAPVIGDVPTGIPGVQIGIPELGFFLSSLEPALILALLGSVESLLTALVADSLTGTQHRPNRELIGQGIGNMVAGMFGGMPGCGSPTMTVTNIRAGGVSRASGVIFSCFMLLLLLGLGDLVAPIPLAVLAGILMKVGWDIIDRRLLSRIHRIRREHLIVMLTTLALTVFVDLVTAVGIGLIAAGMAHAWQLESLELDNVLSVPLLDSKFFAEKPELITDDPHMARVGLVSLRGRFTVASSKRLTEAVGKDIQEHEIVIFDFSQATHLDDSAAMVIDQLLDVSKKADTAFLVMALSGPVLRTLVALDVLDQVPKEFMVETLDEAREVAAAILSDGESKAI